MRAFIPYDANEIKLRQLCRKLQDYGTVNWVAKEMLEGEK